MIYTVTLNPALDYLMYLPCLLPGQISRSGREELQPGGKGVNVSLILRQLGVESTALGFLAGGTGELLRSLIEAHGVKTGFLPLPQGMTRINVKLKSGEESEINGRGPDIPPASLQALLDRLADLEAGDTLVLSGSVPPSLPAKVYGKLLEQVADKGVRTVVDAPGEPLLHALPYRPFLIKPNCRELSDLVGRPLEPTDHVSLLEAARSLQEKGAQNVIVSLAGEGALLVEPDGACHYQAAAKGHLQNSVGAGDSMVAGFLSAYDRLGPKDALRFAAACGAATAFSPRLATLAEISEIDRQLAQGEN